MVGIPVDPTTELIFLAGWVLTIAIVIVQFFVFLISKSRLGILMPRDILTLVLNPSGVYTVMHTQPGEDDLHTHSRDEIFDARNGSIYKPEKGGGPNIAIVDPISDWSMNGRITNYILQMKAGKNPDGIKFNSRNEAYLSYYDDYYLPKHKDNLQWFDEQKLMVKSAKAITVMKSKKTTTEVTTAPTGETTTTQVQEEIPHAPMSDSEYEDFILAINQRLLEETDEIYPITIDGEVITLRDVANWTGSPAPENTYKSKFNQGREFERSLGTKNAMAIMLYVVAIIALLLGGVIAYKLIG